MKSRSSNSRSRILGIPKYLLWGILGVAVIVVVVPIAVMFGRKKKHRIPKSSVIVPLYVYPSPGAWDPLHNAISKNEHLDFIVVVNPSSGPGPLAVPDGNYTREIPILNAHSNVRTVGYVSTNYTNRNISLATEDIKTYASWAGNPDVKNIGMHGIFLDETPSLWTTASGQFLETLRDVIVSQKGLGEDPLIIHNPGTLPSPLYLPLTSLTVIFEETYQTYETHNVQQNLTSFLSTSSGIKREAFACIIHSLPSSVSGKNQKELVKSVREVCGSAFVTGLSVDYYSTFWDGWMDFTGNMAAGS